MLTAEVVIEGSPVEEHQSNGTIEVTVLEIQIEIRVRRSALEERLMSEAR